MIHPVVLRRGRRVGGVATTATELSGPAQFRVPAGSRKGRTSQAPAWRRLFQFLFGAWLGWAAPGAFLPVGVIANHWPLAAPWPRISPGEVSPAYRYTGQPAIVTCRSKSLRTTLPTRAWST